MSTDAIQLDSLYREIDGLLAAKRIRGFRDGNHLLIRLYRSDRTQKIRLTQQDGTFRFTSIVAKVKDVIPGGINARNDLLFRILRRNALKPVVALHIDAKDRIVGEVACTTSSAHHAEIEFYLTTLARDCDRFEYILSGSDRN